jgi:hypothetical protein
MRYHLYFLRGAQVVGFDHIDAAGDEEIERIARERATGETVEVWNGYARVCVCPPANPRPDLFQPLSP